MSAERNRVTEACAMPLGRRGFVKGTGALAMTGLLSGLGACGRSDGRTTLRFYEGKRETIDYFTQVAANFVESQQQFDVALEAGTNLTADFVRDTPPALIMVNANAIWAGYATRGVLSDVRSLAAFDSVRPETLQMTMQFGQYKDEISGLPYSIASGGVIYNKDLFDQAGVDVPTTWSQFKAACETLKSKGITPIYGTFQDGWTIRQGLFDFVVGGGLPDVSQFFAHLHEQGTEIGPDADYSFQKDWAPLCQQMFELLPYFNEDARNLNYDLGNRGFANGGGAMIFQGPWAFSGILSANPDLNLGTFPLPATEDAADTKVWSLLDLVACIPASVSGETRDGAEALMSYLMSPDIVSAYNRDNLAFSPLKDAPPQTNPLVVGLQDYVADGRVFLGPGFFFPPAIPLDQYVQACILSQDASSFLQSLDNDWKRLAVRLSA